MNIDKASKRDRKLKKRKYGHREDGRSTRLMQEIDAKRVIERQRRLKQMMQDFELTPT